MRLVMVCDLPVPGGPSIAQDSPPFSINQSTVLGTICIAYQQGNAAVLLFSVYLILIRDTEPFRLTTRKEILQSGMRFKHRRVWPACRVEVQIHEKLSKAQQT